MYSVCSLFRDTHQLCFYKCKLVSIGSEGEWHYFLSGILSEWMVDRLEESARLHDVFQCTALLCFGTVHFKEIKSVHTTSILYCHPLHDLVALFLCFLTDH